MHSEVAYAERESRMGGSCDLTKVESDFRKGAKEKFNRSKVGK